MDMDPQALWVQQEFKGHLSEGARLQRWAEHGILEDRMKMSSRGTKYSGLRLGKHTTLPPPHSVPARVEQNSQKVLNVNNWQNNNCLIARLLFQAH